MLVLVTATKQLPRANDDAACLAQRKQGHRVDASPAEVRRIPVPAQYGTIKRQELVKAAEVREVETPAEYKTVRSLKVVAPPQERRIPVPAEYQTVKSQVLVAEGKAEWKSILCETNTTPGVVQTALVPRGLNESGVSTR